MRLGDLKNFQLKVEKHVTKWETEYLEYKEKLIDAINEKENQRTKVKKAK